MILIIGAKTERIKKINELIEIEEDNGYKIYYKNDEYDNFKIEKNGNEIKIKKEEKNHNQEGNKNGEKTLITIEKKGKKIYVANENSYYKPIYFSFLKPLMIISTNIYNFFDYISYNYRIKENSFQEYMVNGKIEKPNTYYIEIEEIREDYDLTINYKGEALVAMQIPQIKEKIKRRELKITNNVNENIEKIKKEKDEQKRIELILNAITYNSKKAGQPTTTIEELNLKENITNDEKESESIAKLLIRKLNDEYLDKNEMAREPIVKLFIEAAYSNIIENKQIDKNTMRIINLLFIHKHLRLEGI